MGAIAGCTIFVGLPIGRLRAPMPRTRALLNSLAIGILVFLLWDVLAHAWEPVNGAIEGRRYGPALREGLVLAGGTGLGLVGLVYFDRWVARRARAYGGPPETAVGWRHPPAPLPPLIPGGIGLPHFPPGPALGKSPATRGLRLPPPLALRVG